MHHLLEMDIHLEKVFLSYDDCNKYFSSLQLINVYEFDIADVNKKISNVFMLHFSLYLLLCVMSPCTVTGTLSLSLFSRHHKNKKLTAAEFPVI